MFDTSVPKFGDYSGTKSTKSSDSTGGGSGSGGYSGEDSVTDYISSGGTALAGIIAAWKGQPQSVTNVFGAPNQSFGNGGGNTIVWVVVIAVVLGIMFFAFKKK